MTMTTEPDEGRATVVPETVIVPPGVRVWPPITKLLDDPAIIVDDPIVKAAAEVADPPPAAVRGVVCPLTTTAEPDEANEMVVPETVTWPPGVKV